MSHNIPWSPHCRHRGQTAPWSQGETPPCSSAPSTLCGVARQHITINRNLLSWKNQVNFWLLGCRDCTSSNSDATAHLPKLSGRQSSDGAAPLPAGTSSLGGALGHGRTTAAPLPSSNCAAGESRPVSVEPAEERRRALTNSRENQVTGSTGRQRMSRGTKSVTKCSPGAQQPALPPMPVLVQGKPTAPLLCYRCVSSAPPPVPSPKAQAAVPFPWSLSGLSPPLPSPLDTTGRLLGRPQCPRSWDCCGPARSCAA